METSFHGASDGLVVVPVSCQGRGDGRCLQVKTWLWRGESEASSKCFLKLDEEGGVNHDARVSGSTGDGHKGCIVGVSLLSHFVLCVLENGARVACTDYEGGVVACGVLLRLRCCDAKADGGWFCTVS